MQLQGYELPARALAAALTHAAKNDVRKYLNGVLLDFREGRIIGTDGARMFVGQIPIADCAPVIIGRDQAESVVRASKSEITKGYALVVSVGDIENQHNPLVTVVNVFAGTSHESRALEGRVLDYGRVLPNKDLPELPGSYNARYLLDAQKALAIYSGRPEKRAVFPLRQHGARGPCLMTDPGRPVFSIIMPIRAGEVDITEDLKWFYKPAQADAAQAA